MSEHAASVDSAKAASDTIKAYLRMNRETVAADSELLALLIPGRFEKTGVSDMQRFLIEKLRDENRALRTELDSPRGPTAVGSRGGIKKLVLELLDARSLDETVRIATASAPIFGGIRATLCVEGEGSAPKDCDGVRLIEPGTAAAVLGRDGTGAILSRGGDLLLGKGGSSCRSIAVFRLHVGADAPACMYAVGAQEAAHFDCKETTSDIGFFARALERSIRAWLDLPKL